MLFPLWSFSIKQAFDPIQLYVKDVYIAHGDLYVNLKKFHNIISSSRLLGQAIMFGIDKYSSFHMGPRSFWGDRIRENWWTSSSRSWYHLLWSEAGSWVGKITGQFDTCSVWQLWKEAQTAIHFVHIVCPAYSSCCRYLSLG